MVDHTKDNFWEALDVSEERFNEIAEESQAIIKRTERLSEIIEQLSQSDMTGIEKLCIAYCIGEVAGQCDI